MNALMDPMAIGQQVQQSIMGGYQMAREAKANEALAAYGQNPSMEGVQGIMRHDPRMGLQVQGMEQQRVQQEQAAADALAAKMQESTGKIATLLQRATPENWGHLLNAAQQMGFDTSRVPAQYDEGWVGQQKLIAQFLQTPNGIEAASTAGKQAMDMGLQPGTEPFQNMVRQLIEMGAAQAYTGSQGETRVYTPQLGGQGQSMGGISGPQPGAVEDGYRFKGGDPSDQSNWEPVQEGGTGGGSATFSGGFRGLAGERITSTYRDPAHNRRVGGVSGSYHTRRDKNGKAMARDSVPPPGMSMSAYAAELRRLNPHLEVINEGDHVHMEPRG